MSDEKWLYHCDRMMSGVDMRLNWVWWWVFPRIFLILDISFKSCSNQASVDSVSGGIRPLSFKWRPLLGNTGLSCFNITSVHHDTLSGKPVEVLFCHGINTKKCLFLLAFLDLHLTILSWCFATFFSQNSKFKSLSSYFFPKFCNYGFFFVFPHKKKVIATFSPHNPDFFLTFASLQVAYSDFSELWVYI